MTHLFFIDQLDKLNIKKDSSLMMALTFKNEGGDVKLLFEEDFYLVSKGSNSLRVFEFEGEFESDGIYLKSLELGESSLIELNAKSSLYMRVDPPFDTRYLRFLWMLDFLKKKHHVKVYNDPIGIMNHNEKLLAFEQADSLETFVGSSMPALKAFMKLYSGIDDWILKPLDLFSGIGVSRHSSIELEEVFKAKTKEFGGAVVVQPFEKSVHLGEIRSIYFKGQELGTILKIPPKGSFLSNIAQGADFHSFELSEELAEKLEKIALHLKEEGVDLVAFDVLGDRVTEVNITCPGLLVEVSKALGKNLCLDIYRQYA